MEVGHGEGGWVVSAQRKPERKKGRGVRVGEEEEERPGRKAGGGSKNGWRRDWVFKREGNAMQRPVLPVALGVLGGGQGLNPALLGGLEEMGEAGYQGCSVPTVPGCRMRVPRYRMVAWCSACGG